MGTCFCIPSKPNINTQEHERFVQTKEAVISPPTSNHSKNQSPKNNNKPNMIENGNGAGNKTDNMNGNNDEDEEDIRDVSQIFIKNDNENLDNENIKNQSKIKLEDFKLLKVVGKGSFGKVMLVEKKDTKKLYAMKMLVKSEIEKRNQKIHTLAERQILENAKCPFIIQLHFAFQTEKKLYLVMDFMRGGELFFHLRKAKRLDEKRAKLYAAEMIVALEYLHSKGTVYRDLKPENILLDFDGHIKLADFGLSKQGLMEGDKTYTFCGTPEYLAPEILLGVGHDRTCDWWSLGALLYEMLSGAPPFYSRDKNQMFNNRLEKQIPMKPYFSAEACSILQGLLCLDPEKRLGSANEGAEEIKNHPFFKDIDWSFVCVKAYEPPFKPKFSSSKDLDYFDRMFTDEPVQDTLSNASMGLHINTATANKNLYPGFTYAKKEMMVSDSMKISKIEESSEMIENPLFELKT